MVIQGPGWYLQRKVWPSRIGPLCTLGGVILVLCRAVGGACRRRRRVHGRGRGQFDARRERVRDESRGWKEGRRCVALLSLGGSCSAAAEAGEGRKVGRGSPAEAAALRRLHPRREPSCLGNKNKCGTKCRYNISMVKRRRSTRFLACDTCDHIF